MPTTITGTDGVSQVQTGAVESGDLPAGSVIQVVEATITSPTNANSTSYVNSNIQASITPYNSSNKILVFASISADFIRENNDLTGLYQRLIREPSQILTEKFGFIGAQPSSTGFIYSHINDFIASIDFPNTTSEVTYKVQGKVSDNANAAQIRYQQGTSKMFLLEIAG